MGMSHLFCQPALVAKRVGLADLRLPAQGSGAGQTRHVVHFSERVYDGNK
jgi:hypothetical protein